MALVVEGLGELEPWHARDTATAVRLLGSGLVALGLTVVAIVISWAARGRRVTRTGRSPDSGGPRR